MKRHHIPATLLLAAALLSCSKEEPEISVTQEDAEVAETLVTSSIVYVSEELASQLETSASEGKLHTKSLAMNSVLDELGAESFTRFFEDAGEFEPRTRKAGLHRWYEITFSEPVLRTKASDDLAAVPGIEKVHEPVTVKTTSVPNDAYFKWQWNLYNDKSLDLDITYMGEQASSNEGADINVLPVWESFTTGSSSVIVSVVDEGIDLDHPDLEANCIPGGEDGSKNFVNNSYNISAGDHGSHVAGVIAAVRGNGIGVAGIAGGDYDSGLPGVRLMSCQIFTANSSASSANCAKAIKWGADHGAVISQNSWGYSYDTDDDGELSSRELEEALAGTITDLDKDAVDYFIAYAGCDNDGNQLADSPMKGGVVIMAAGNDGIEVGAPANYEPIIAVGSTQADWNPSWFTNYGDWVDISAPGGDGYGAGWGSANDGIYSRGNIYSTYAANSNDTYYRGQSYGYMNGTSMACPHVSGVAALVLSYFGGQGFTNADLEKALIEGANYEHVNVTTPVGPALDAYGAFKVAWTINPEVEINFPPEAVGGLSISAFRKSVTVSFTVPSDENEGIAKGAVCLLGVDRDALEDSTPSNLASGVMTTRSPFGELGIGDGASLTFTGLKYSTTYHARVYAYDSHLAYSSPSAIVSVTTPDNNPPQLTSEIGDMIMWTGQRADSLDLAAHIADPDEDAVFYSFVSNTNSWTLNASVNSNGKVGFRPYGNGFSEITVKATDEDGASSEFSFRVLVKEADDPVEMFPVPVTSTFTIRNAEEATAHVRIVSSGGGVVYDGTSTFSGFAPLTIDLSSCAPGRYSVSVTIGDSTYRRTITKI